MRDQRVNVGAIALQIREYENVGEVIIFLHFGGGNLMMWQKAVPYFQENYHLILVDLRGHGKSDKPRMGNHIDQMAKDVVGILENLELEKAHIIGCSLGAEVGLSLAANFPERVISLVCDGGLYSESGPYGIWDGSEADFKVYVDSKLAEQRERPVPNFPSIAELVAARRQVMEKYGYWNEYIEAFTEYDACETAGGLFTMSCPKWAKLEYLEHYYNYRFEDYYKKVKRPVLMLPDEEFVQSGRMNQAMQGLCNLTSKGKIVAVPGWDHPYGWLLDPDEMCKVVMEFLSEIRN
jgi:pimeloyl-ACP methyl ester carboxylesterase